MTMVMTSAMSEESEDDIIAKTSNRNASLASHGTAGSLSDTERGGLMAKINIGEALALLGGGGGGPGGGDEDRPPRRVDILEEDRRTRRWQVERTAARLNRVRFEEDRQICSNLRITNFLCSEKMEYIASLNRVSCVQNRQTCSLQLVDGL